MRKFLITIAVILGIAGTILLNALTFSSRYKQMTETRIIVKSANDTFMGKQLKAFFQREDLEEKLTGQLEELALFPDHPSWNQELASLIVATGKEISLEDIRLQGRRYYGGYRIRFTLPPDEAALWEKRIKEKFANDSPEDLASHSTSRIKLKKYSGWEEKTSDQGTSYHMGSAVFLVTESGLTQLVYITAISEKTEKGLTITLFIADHDQGQKGIPFLDMALADTQ